MKAFLVTFGVAVMLGVTEELPLTVPVVVPTEMTPEDVMSADPTTEAVAEALPPATPVSNAEPPMTSKLPVTFMVVVPAT